MTRSEEKVAASSFKALSSFLSFIIVSDTMLFSVSYLVFKLDRANSAVCIDQKNKIIIKPQLLLYHSGVQIIGGFAQNKES